MNSSLQCVFCYQDFELIIFWQVKDSLRSDPRYKSIKHEDREIFFNQYISELKAAEAESERVLKEKNNEEVGDLIYYYYFFLLEMCDFILNIALVSSKNGMLQF